MQIDMTQTLVQELLGYEPETGVFRWRTRARHWFTSDHQCNAWNGRFAGVIAGQINKCSGYHQIAIFRRLYQAHRLAWLYVHGEWPVEIDHINQEKSDNRILNLRNVSHQVNCTNKRLVATNKSGVSGVHFSRRVGKWLAQIGDKGDQVTLGVFADKADAVSARREAEKRLGYHPNHGGSTHANQ